jgi:hypothetical protein
MAWLPESRSVGQIIVKRYTKTPIWKQGGVLLWAEEKPAKNASVPRRAQRHSRERVNPF